MPTNRLIRLQKQRKNPIRIFNLLKFQKYADGVLIYLTPSTLRFHKGHKELKNTKKNAYGIFMLTKPHKTLKTIDITRLHVD
jgi:hypothetical protein